ncbi:MAG: SDR family NAD(P)-dependent oxidoreductase, partial [Candidatus Gastranaerophilales bacterium]|nr:SDR family NAD(P)-dependent oxidoreductase [Candidatus Gastranaerophilales bacterium]
MKNILLTGGAGYIGSLATKKLLDKGYRVTVLDSLEKGKIKFVDKRAKFYKVDITDYKKLEKITSNKHFDIILHFAGLKDAGESMINSEKYQKNIIGTINLIRLSQKLKVK